MQMKKKNSKTDRKRFEIGPSKIRSAVANGSRLLNDLDARSAPARRFRDIMQDIISDCGGRDEISEMELHLIRNVAGLVVMRENLDTKILQGEHVDTGVYCRLSNSLNRILSTLGLKRRVIDVSARTIRDRLTEAA